MYQTQRAECWPVLPCLQLALEDSLASLASFASILPAQEFQRLQQFTLQLQQLCCTQHLTAAAKEQQQTQQLRSLQAAVQANTFVHQLKNRRLAAAAAALAAAQSDEKQLPATADLAVQVDLLLSNQVPTCLQQRGGARLLEYNGQSGAAACGVHFHQRKQQEQKLSTCELAADTVRDDTRLRDELARMHQALQQAQQMAQHKEEAALAALASAAARSEQQQQLLLQCKEERIQGLQQQLAVVKADADSAAADSSSELQHLQAQLSTLASIKVGLSTRSMTCLQLSNCVPQLGAQRHHVEVAAMLPTC